MMRERRSPAVQRVSSRKIREVMSDLFITVGVLVLFFYVWYVWLGDILAGAQQDAAGVSLSAVRTDA